MAGRRAEGRAQGDFIIVKEKDKASPLLAHAAPLATTSPRWKLSSWSAGAAGTNKRNRYMKFQLQDVYVSSFKSGNSSSATVGGNRSDRLRRCALRLRQDGGNSPRI